MDSINKIQQEKDHQNLENVSAVKKIKELVDIAKTCFFTTDGGNKTRPMTVQQVDEGGGIWFLSANNSHTNQEILANPIVKLYFQGSAHSDFLYLEGEATIFEDKDKIQELWDPILKTWFTEGADDPRISVIKVNPVEGYYWDNKHGNIVAGVKMLIGAALGKTMDDSIEGELRT